MNAKVIESPVGGHRQAIATGDCVAAGRSLPTRTKVNFCLDGLLLVNLVVLGWVSVVTRFIFPPGPASVGWSLWGLNYDHWATVQFASLAVFYVGILLHVMLHWSWVCNVVSVWCAPLRREKPDDGVQTIYGVGFMIILLGMVGIALAAAVFSLVRPPV